MVYYDEFSSFEGKLLNTLYRIFSTISFIPYVSLLIVYFFGKTKENFTMVINLQLCIASMMHSASYLFPSLATSENGSPLCIIQALLNSLSDVCSIVIATFTLIISYINFTNPELIEKRKCFYLIIICIVCWIIPLIICIFILFYGNVASNGDAFCWVNNFKVTYAYLGICLLFYICFFFTMYKIINGIRDFLKQSSATDMYDKYISTFVRFCSVVCLTFSVFSLNCGIVIVGDLGIALPGQIEFAFYLIAQIGELISCPAYVILYAFNSTRFKELKNILCFRDRKSIISEISDYNIKEQQLINQNSNDISINESDDMTIDTL